MESNINGHIDTLIWDWNGTLLDDISICIKSINQLLTERNLPNLTPNTYRNVFTFPVKEYYEAIGFNFKKEDWDKVAHDFISRYDQNLSGSKLFPEVKEVLSAFQKQRFKQYMVSAMQHDFLEKTVSDLGIRDFFIELSGIKDHFANSKIDMAKDFIDQQEIDKRNACLIGDTLHDFEVAEELGIPCILVANGHQSFDRLKKSGTVVLHNLSEVPAFFKQNGKSII